MSYIVQLITVPHLHLAWLLAMYHRILSIHLIELFELAGSIYLCKQIPYPYELSHVTPFIHNAYDQSELHQWE